MLVHFSRLAFLPQVQSSFIREFHALRPALRSEFDIDYWDFRAVEGFGSSSPTRDRPSAGPSEERDPNALLSPPERGRAHHGDRRLASPSLTSRLTATREGSSLVLILALIIAGSAALAYFWSSPGSSAAATPSPGSQARPCSSGCGSSLSRWAISRGSNRSDCSGRRGGLRFLEGPDPVPGRHLPDRPDGLGACGGLRGLLFARREGDPPPARPCRGRSSPTHRRRGFLRRGRRRRL